MVLKIIEAGEFRIKPSPLKVNFLKRLINIIKKKADNKIHIDDYFSDSNFGPQFLIKSYYGGGEINIGINNLLMGTINIESPNGEVFIGDNSFIGGNTYINSINSITIGNNVLIAGNCTLQDHDSHSLNYLDRRNDIEFALARFKGRSLNGKDFDKIKSAPIKIGNDCWIGQNSIILKGVTIGDRSIVGAGSIVTKDIPSDSIYAGNPAKNINSKNKI